MGTGPEWMVCAAGFFAAMMNSIAGGGTMLTFPALLAAGLPGVLANTTSCVALFIGLPGSVWSFRRHLAGTKAWLVPLGAVSLVSGLAGGILLLALPSSAFDVAVPWLLLLATALFVFHAPLQRWVRGKAAAAPEPDAPRPWGLGVQALVGLYGGYFGAGIGIMMLAGLSGLGLRDINRMNALKGALAILINGSSVVYFIARGEVHWPLAFWLMGGSIPGYFLGATLAQRIPAQWVRGIAGAIGIAIACILWTR
jgi:uncharacterized membrane protein YfcA